jgi:signal transduction histidine kinase
VEVRPIQGENGNSFTQKITSINKNEIFKKDGLKKKSLVRQNSEAVIIQALKLPKPVAQAMSKYFVSFEIIIKDSGRGIPKEDQSKLFLNFSKLADEEGLNKTGTGLGLSICKHLIEKMGGEVKVHSDGIGHGTSFIIKL